MIFRPKSPSTPEPGEKYRSYQMAGVSHPQLIWTVEEVHRATDGHTYAVLVNGVDPTRRKTVAVGALLDRTLYTPFSA